MLEYFVTYLMETFNLFGFQIYDPLISYFNLTPVFVGFFCTFTLYRFIAYPMLNGSSGFGKLVGSAGSDEVRKRK